MTDEEMLQANAKLAMDTLSPLSDVSAFGYNRESVAWVEGYIERQRTRSDLTPETLDGMAQVLGSFLGQCFDDSNAAYPFNKVRKQLQNGADGSDSILAFFDSIGPLFKRFQQ